LLSPVPQRRVHLNQGYEKKYGAGSLMENLPDGAPESPKKTAWLCGRPNNVFHGLILDQKGGCEAPNLDDLDEQKAQGVPLRLGAD
jgi:hypothetical protein